MDIGCASPKQSCRPIPVNPALSVMALPQLYVAMPAGTLYLGSSI